MNPTLEQARADRTDVGRMTPCAGDSQTLHSPSGAAENAIAPTNDAPTPLGNFKPAENDGEDAEISNCGLSQKIERNSDAVAGALDGCLDGSGGAR